MSVSIQSKSLGAEVGTGILSGLVLTSLTGHMVNGFGRISVVASQSNLSTFEAFKQIRSGIADGSLPTYRNFAKGAVPYFIRESFRALGKSTATPVLVPRLERIFAGDPHRSLKVSLAFSATLSFWEGVGHSIDTCCSKMQAEKVIPPRIFTEVFRTTPWGELYAGTVANVSRQFGQYMIFKETENKCNEVLEKKTSINPNGMTGIILKSFPISLCVTAPMYIFQRTKVELQCREGILNQAREEGLSRYVVALRNIWRMQGFSGFVKGLPAKTVGNTYLVGGLCVFLAIGRAAHTTEVKK